MIYRYYDEDEHDRPRNVFCLVVANFCYQVQDQVAKLVLCLQNCVYIFTPRSTWVVQMITLQTLRKNALN